MRLRKPILALALCCTLAITACTAAQISAYINLAAQIAANVLQIVSAFGNTPVSAHDTQLVASFQAVLQTSVSQFEANKSAGSSTLVAVAATAESTIAQWLAAAQFDNPALNGRIIAAADSFVTIVEAIAATVQPNVVVPPAPAPVALKGGAVHSFPARVKTPRANIVIGWNTVVCAGAVPACQVK